MTVEEAGKVVIAKNSEAGPAAHAAPFMLWRIRWVSHNSEYNDEDVRSQISPHLPDDSRWS